MNKNNISKKTITLNRRARYEYFIEDTLDAGIALLGTEVKSLRLSKISIDESFCEFQDGELYLINSHIPEYNNGGSYNHSPKRARKLLLNAKEIRKLYGLIEKKGFTIVPLEVYFNKRNLCKIKIATAKGKKLHDKREALKQKDWERQKRSMHKNI